VSAWGSLLTFIGHLSYYCLKFLLVNTIITENKSKVAVSQISTVLG